MSRGMVSRLRLCDEMTEKYGDDRTHTREKANASFAEESEYYGGREYVDTPLCDDDYAKKPAQSPTYVASLHGGAPMIANIYDDERPRESPRLSESRKGSFPRTDDFEETHDPSPGSSTNGDMPLTSGERDHEHEFEDSLPPDAPVEPPLEKTSSVPPVAPSVAPPVMPPAEPPLEREPSLPPVVPPATSEQPRRQDSLPPPRRQEYDEKFLAGVLAQCYS